MSGELVASGGAADTASAHRAEVERGERFEFGKNWSRFLRELNPQRIVDAEQSLRTMLGRERLDGVTFLDAGSGSGLFSLAAFNLGAAVRSFDYDTDSVACTTELRRRFAGGAGERWTVEQASVLDASYIDGLGQFDIVYSWGVLHHTGKMWLALEHAARCVAPGGQLFVAIYNHQGAWTPRWHRIKRLYCSGRLGRALVTGTLIPWWVMRGAVADIVWGRDPRKRYQDSSVARGMTVVYDWFDWLGGLPFEAARPEEIFEFHRARGFNLERLTTAGGSHGCNEFVFRRA